LIPSHGLRSSALFAIRPCFWCGRGVHVFACAHVLQVFSEAADILVEGPPVVLGEWVHLVAGYDGTMARLWVNAQLVRSVEVRPLVLREADRKLTE